MTLPAGSAKNFGLSSAAQDLGLGDMLGQQLIDEQAERKKRLLKLGGNPAGQFGNDQSSAAMMLFGKNGGLGA